MRVKATLPLRVDIGGGVTDVPELGSQIGTSIANIAIDLFEDESYKTRTSVNVEASYSEDGNRLFLNGQELKLHSPLDEHGFLAEMFLSFLKKTQTTKSVSLRIGDTLPKGTGLGASAALSLCVLASLYKLKGDEDTLSADRLIKEAHYFETTEQGIQGGFQDYIAAYFGGYNHIDFPSLKDSRLSGLPTLGQKLPAEIEEFLNENMLFVIRRTENIGSSVIVEDEVSNFLRDRPFFEPYLQSIKSSNDAVNSIFTSPTTDWCEKLADEIKLSWEGQKRLSELVGSGYIKELEEIVRPLVYALRGPGAGGNSLFLLANPSRKAELIQRLSKMKDEVVILYGRVNNRGLELSVS